MKKKCINISVDVLSYDELSTLEAGLVDIAKNETQKAYAPYSQFQVGASIILENNTLVAGSNQENAAYPSGLCAERTAMFYANSNYPNSKPLMMAIASYADGDFTPQPITPCGACRQVLIETETRYNTDITILLYGRDIIYRLHSAKDLMPLAFDQSALKSVE